MDGPGDPVPAPVPEADEDVIDLTAVTGHGYPGPVTGQATRAGIDAATVDDLPDEDPAPDHDVRAVLRLTSFRRLWIACGLSSLGDWLGLLATAAMAGALTQGSYAAQNMAIALVFILRLAPAVVLGPLAGAVADRLDRRWTMVVGDLLRFVLFASIVLVGTLQWLFVATVLIECVALFWSPANDATVPNLVPRRRLEAANQLNLVATFGSAPIAGLLYAVLSVLADGSTAMPSLPDINPVTVALWVNAITFLISALVIWRLDLPYSRAREAAREASVIRSIVDGWRFVMATRLIRGLVLGMLGAFAAGGLVVGLAQTFVADLGGGQAGFGVMFGAVFTGLAVGMWVGPRVLAGFSRRRLFGLALSAAGVFLVLLALVPNLVLAVLFTVTLGICGGIAWVTGYTLLGLEVDDEVRGRTFAFVHSAARVVLVLALAGGPALAAGVGRHTLVLPWNEQLVYNGGAWVFGLAGVIALAVGALAYRSMDDRPGSRLRNDLVAAWVEQRRSDPATGPQGPSRPRQHNGWLIAFEGGDGTGKSTQARVLADWLRSDQGHDVVLTREPGATAIGVRLREVLLGEGESVGPRAEALLFAADRAHHVDSLVRPALARGAIVITDRYIDSSISYQGVGRNLGADDIAYISRWATGGLVPDLTVLLDIPPEISRVRRANDPERAGSDRIEAQPEDFHDRVRQSFLELARREPHRYLVLDGSDPREQIQQTIRARIRDLVPISRKRRAELAARLAAEEDARRRRAGAEAEVLRLDAELRGRSRDQARARQEATRRAREEADRQLQEEVERRYAEESERAATAARTREPGNGGPDSGGSAPPSATQDQAPAGPSLRQPGPDVVPAPPPRILRLPDAGSPELIVAQLATEPLRSAPMAPLAPAAQVPVASLPVTEPPPAVVVVHEEPRRRPRGEHVATYSRRAWFTDAGETEPLPLLHLDEQGIARSRPVVGVHAVEDPVPVEASPAPERSEAHLPEPSVTHPGVAAPAGAAVEAAADLRDQLFGRWGRA